MSMVSCFFDSQCTVHTTPLPFMAAYNASIESVCYHKTINLVLNVDVQQACAPLYLNKLEILQKPQWSCCMPTWL